MSSQQTLKRTPQHDFSLAIMAGGKSSRMGQNKALVTLGGQTMIERIITRTANIGQATTLLITNHASVYEHLGLPMVADVMPDKGALGGIYTALNHSVSAYTVVIACDMPFVSAPLLCAMLAATADTPYDALVPRVDGYPQGLCAVYHRRCLKPIRKRLVADQLRVGDVYADVNVCYFDEADYRAFTPDKRAFMNVNTPDDLRRARELARIE